MVISYSYSPFNRVDYYPQESGNSAVVYLHDNIEETEVNGQTQYSADEISFTTNLTKQEVEDNFDTLWVKYEIESKPIEERVSELEDLVGIIIDEMLEV